MRRSTRRARAAMFTVIDRPTGGASSARSGTAGAQTGETAYERIGATQGAAPMMCARSVRQRIGPHLNVYGARLCALAAFLQPRRAVAVRAPQPAALPAGVRVIDSAVQALGKEAQRIGDAQHDHLPILERGEAVIEVGRRDRDVLAKPHRVVVVHPGVVARLGAPVLEPLEGRARILVVREAFGAVVAGRSGPVERTLALVPVEADERAV